MGDMTADAPTPRTVLITGGSRGIGLACARAFAAAGDRVAVTFSSTPVDEPGILAV
jgi:3-oxoacyl-[acyl-carrier protein] reductase